MADESWVGRRQEDLESKLEYIITFPEGIWNFTSRKKRTSEHYSDEKKL